jgi:methylated-DNA-[protein]-cysteine S-methyltransferase
MTTITRHRTIPSPIGPLTLRGTDDEVLTGLSMDGQRHEIGLPPRSVRDDEAFAKVVDQLDAYFGGELTEFDVAFDATGTEFQRRVWRALCDIPYGETISYGELARRVGNPKASRAVGLANGRNPIAIIVPCHRVIGASGTLTGYGGGVERKRALLELESARPALL